MSYDGVSPAASAGRRSSRRTSVAPEGGDEDPQAVVVRNLWRRRYLLPPYQSRWSARRRYWGLVLLACSFYESFAIPFQLAFYHSAAGVPPSLIDSLGGKRDNNKKADQAAEYQKAQAQRAQARGRLEQSAEKSGWGDLEEVTSAAVSTAVL